MRLNGCALAAFGCSLLVSAGASAQFSYDESIDGDLTGDRAAPTPLAAGLGSNILSGTVIDGDVDYFRFTVPAGLELAEINLLSFDSTADQIAFIGVQAGGSITVDPAAADPATLLGYVLYGPTLVGTNIIDEIGTGPGAIGFTGSLPAGEYSFWNQQTGNDLTGYSFEFVLVPGPAGAGLLCGAGLLAARRRR